MWQNPRSLLTAGFSVLAGLMAVIIIVALHSLNSIGNRFEHSAGREMEAVFALERLEKAGLRAISSTNELVVVATFGIEDDDDLDDEIEGAEEREESEVEEALEKLEAELTAFLSINSGENGNEQALFTEQQVSETKALVQELKETSSEVTELAESGAPAHELFEEREELEDVEIAFLAFFDELLASSGQRFRQSQTAVAGTIEQSTVFLVIGGIVALSVALLAALASSSRIIAIMRRLELTMDELGKKTTDLQDTQQQLVQQEKLATLGQLTATVSHELRNPLGAARTSLYLVRQKAEKAGIDLERPVGRAERSILRCDNIIGELLDFARETPPKLVSLSLEEWLSGELDGYNPSSPVEIERKFSLDGLRVDLDADRFRRVLINLLDNACDAVNEGNGAKKVSVQAEARGDRVEFEIVDTGAGIDEATLERIFEPLFSTKSFGVGLGLPTVKKIVESHGGDISFRSVVGSGTTVTVSLPVSRRTPSEGPSKSMIGENTAKAELAEA